MYGFWLNLDRSHAHAAQDVSHGTAVAFGAKPDPGMLAALARDERELAALESEVRKRQKEARVHEKYGF